MAYMSQENKKTKHEALKRVIPPSWKWSLSVNHHSTLVLTIQSAPVDLLGEWIRVVNENRARRGDYYEPINPTYADVNVYYIKDQFDKSAAIMHKIYDAMMVGNHDRSDSMTDYFDVGWYVDIKLGRWNKPFICTGRQVECCLGPTPQVETTEQKIARLEAENAKLRASV